MIADRTQYLVTLDAIASYEEALNQLDNAPLDLPELDPDGRALLRRSMQGQLDALRAEVVAYEASAAVESTLRHT